MTSAFTEVRNSVNLLRVTGDRVYKNPRLRTDRQKSFPTTPIYDYTLCIKTQKVTAMTQKKKRVQVQLPLDVFEIVEEISSIGGVAMGVLLAEIIVENKHGLEMIRDAVISAKNQDLSGAIDRLQAGLLDSMSKGMALTKEMNEAKINKAKK